jgi:hypothetical protein
MRRSDLERLRQPYPPNDTAESRFPKALGVHVQHALTLETALLDDLDPVAFGIGWWSTYSALGDKRRILVGDYLITSVASIPTNLVEADLHLRELLEAWDQQNAQMADAIAVVLATGRPRIRHPRETCAADRLADAMSTLHVAGFFRAINSALDCLGAAIIGVAGLNLPIVTSDFDKAKTNLVSKAKLAGDPRQALNVRLDDLIAQAGPPGWLTWTTKFRHMLLHRARRLQDGELVQRKPVLHGPTGTVVPRADVVPHLPSEPARSDIDAFRDTALERYLGEHSSETVHGVLKSTVFVIDGATEALGTLWAQRKANPQLFEQPAAQWLRTDIPDPVGFMGYAPRASTATLAAANESLIRRLTCAALGDDDRQKWATFT